MTKDAQTRQIKALRLIILNRTSEDTMFGNVNSLGALQEISFVLNERELLILSIQNGDEGAVGMPTYNSIGHYVSNDVNERGVAVVTREQYESIISAKSVAVQIKGSKRNVVYEAKELSPPFLGNLKSFYEKYISEPDKAVAPSTDPTNDTAQKTNAARP